MDNDKRRFESVFSKKVRAGKRRTYFFDVRQTKGDDYYLTLTESTRKFNSEGYDRHKIFLYKEDFNRFMSGLEETLNYIKTELMPDYDYDEYTRRHEEWEAKRALEEAEGIGYSANKDETASNDVVVDDVVEEVTEEVSEEPVAEKPVTEKPVTEEPAAEEKETPIDTEDDMSW